MRAGTARHGLACVWKKRRLGRGMRPIVLRAFVPPPSSASFLAERLSQERMALEAKLVEERKRQEELAEVT